MSLRKKVQRMLAYYSGFRLISLELQNHFVLAPHGQRCRLVFCDNSDEEKCGVNGIPYTTVIIGANGIGKSHILSTIAEVFRSIKLMQEDWHSTIKLPFKYEVEYYANGHVFNVSTLSTHRYYDKGILDDAEYRCLKDGGIVPLSHCDLPSSVLACSITVNDKFKTQPEHDGFYWYLGIRNENTPASTGTRTIVRKTVSAIAEGLSHDDSFRVKLLDLLQNLGLQRKMEIEYSIRYRKVYMPGIISKTEFEDIFSNWKPAFEKAGSKRNNAPWGHKNFQSISAKPGNIDIMVDYINALIRKKSITKGNHIVYHLEERSLVEDWKAIQLLSKLDILSFPKIRIYKECDPNNATESFLFEDSSSGETNMLCQFVSILSRIDQRSLVLIDEPETSSHPNWQIQYIKLLNTIFGHYQSAHFIISTHSHFLLSDLEPRSSTIIALERKNGQLSSIEGLNTFCWSTDDILYRVFHVRNTRNRVFENDIMTLYKMMSEGSNDYVTMHRLIDTLSFFELPGNDPLKVILNKARDYVEA